MNGINETRSTGGQHNVTQALNSTTAAPRPDWLLYVIPSIAFVIGLLLFSMVYKTQRRREKMFRRVAALKTVMNSTATGHTYSRYTSQHMGENKNISKLQNSNSEGNLKKQDAQSYENVTSIIYNNEEKVNYCLRKDEDYITPDGTDETDNSTYLQPVKNLRETESYENMDGCVYSHPRQPRLKNALSTGDDDYVNPDVEGKRNLEQTDTESYENMAGSICPGTRAHTSTQDEGWYECMDRRQGLTYNT